MKLSANNISGFVGKSVLEKLLRCCPKINKLFILVRQKRGLKSKERVAEILSSRLFERVINREGLEQCVGKFVPVEGDLTEENLGISEADEAMLVQSNIGVVFHSAATIRFNEPIKYVC